jgi:toxin YhaV
MKRSKGLSPSDAGLAIKGWQIFAHPLLLDQLERLVGAVEEERAKNPRKYQASANAKLLRALSRLLFETIPDDPARPEYRLGNTLGADHRHWFRAKFGGQRFRLFFRYDSRAKIIVYAWVNDNRTLRTYGAKTDAYVVFASMLRAGDPPDDWNALLSVAKNEPAQARLRRSRAPPRQPRD